MPRTLTFAGADKIRDLAERGGGLPNLEAKQMLEYGITSGRGGVYLALSQDQFAKLR